MHVCFNVLPAAVRTMFSELPEAESAAHTMPAPEGAMATTPAPTKRTRDNLRATAKRAREEAESPERLAAYHRESFNDSEMMGEPKTPQTKAGRAPTRASS